jgi:6-phosphogluconolactonase
MPFSPMLLTASTALLHRQQRLRARLPTAPTAAARLRSVTLFDETDSADATTVAVYPSTEAVGDALCKCIVSVAQEAIRTRGAFSFAVPGGSVLKLLAGLSGEKSVDWSRCCMAYANHKALALDDEKSTHKKARALFLDSLTTLGLSVLAPDGGADAEKEAAAYCAKLDAEKRIEAGADGTRIFDLVLLGVGADGHVGSLYPERPELELTGAPCVAVQKGSGPGSITLSLLTMCAARSIVLCMVGESKADAVKLALEKKVAKGSFPAQLVRGSAGVHWLLDAGAASKLGAVTGLRQLI